MFMSKLSAKTNFNKDYWKGYFSNNKT